MGKQFADVSSRYGAPMGRRNDTGLNDEPRTVQLFRVHLDRGGYDDGGAYWGIGVPIYCARDNEGSMQTIRAGSRVQAALKLNIPVSALKVRPPNAADYGLAVLDGRAPMPEGFSRVHVLEWLKTTGLPMGQPV